MTETYGEGVSHSRTHSSRITFAPGTFNSFGVLPTPTANNLQTSCKSYGTSTATGTDMQHPLIAAAAGGSPLRSGRRLVTRATISHAASLSGAGRGLDGFLRRKGSAAAPRAAPVPGRIEPTAADGDGEARKRDRRATLRRHYLEVSARRVTEAAASARGGAYADQQFTLTERLRSYYLQSDASGDDCDDSDDADASEDDGDDDDHDGGGDDDDDDDDDGDGDDDKEGVALEQELLQKESLRFDPQVLQVLLLD